MVSRRLATDDDGSLPAAYSAMNPSEPQQDSDERNPWVEDNGRRLGKSGPSSTHGSALDLPRWGLTKGDSRRSSLESKQSQESWEMAGDEELDRSMEEKDGSSPNNHKMNVSTVKRKPLAGPSQSSGAATGRSLSYDFASNNPFRQKMPTQTASEDGNAGEDSHGWSDPVDQTDQSARYQDKGKAVARDRPADTAHVQLAANLSLDDRPFWEYSPSFRPSYVDLNSEYKAQQPARQPTPEQILPPSTRPPPVPHPPIGAGERPPLIPVSSEFALDHNPWAPESRQLAQPRPAAPEYSSVSQDVAFGRPFDDEQETGVVSLHNPRPGTSDLPQIHQLPSSLEQVDLAEGPPPPRRVTVTDVLEDSANTSQSPGQQPTRQTRPQDLLGDDALEFDGPPPKPPRKPAVPYQPSEEFEPPGLPPPTKPPRPTVRTDLSAELKEQRNETYQIKHFNWYDHNTRTLRRSSMLTQNNNGPCPLLALVNALILSKPDDAESALGNALRSREQVSLGLLIESLVDELMSEGVAGTLEELPDVDELNRFLLRLHTGMNANPRFVPAEEPAPNIMDARNSMLHIPMRINTDRKPGTFELTKDITLYGAFSIPLVHGWLPPRSDAARAAFRRAAPTYEDAQTIQFGEEELEAKISLGGLTKAEQQLWDDIVAIRGFFTAYPTQLTPFGLGVVSDSLFPGALAIMFRNDHFSTIYKHPQSGQLFTLVTDAGYADKDEVIWESLVDVSGQESDFFSGDFRPVGNVEAEHTSTPPRTSGQRRASTQRYETPLTTAAPLSPQEIQQQHDADFAMALQLQEEENARANDLQRRSESSRQPATGRTSNIPIRLRPQESGPPIPPRNQRSANVGVNRPAAAAEEDAPPAYEEAAKGEPYIPPPGHPQHPQSDPSPRGSSSAISPMVSNPAPRTPRPSLSQAQPQRRMSAYQDNSGQWVPHGSSYQRADPQWPTLYSGGKRPKEQDKDCIVM